MKNRQDKLNCFKSCFIAHRGFFNNSTDAPENTILAFKKAVESGYGIELDVQITKDKQIVVAHDYDLKRLCDKDVLIKDLSYNELCEYKILNSCESIPLLTDVLNVIDARVPLIVEIKAKKEYKEVTEITSKILSDYKGPYCIESFSPYVVGWYKRNNPAVIRGQLSSDFVIKKIYKSAIKNWVLTNMVYNIFSKPDFIAYNHKYGDKKCIKFWKKILDCSTVAWTVKSQEELDQALKMFDIAIFDSFTPSSKPTL